MGRWVKVTAGGVPPSFKTQTNTQTVAGDTRPVAFFLPPFHIFAYHFTPDLIGAFRHPLRGKDGWWRREGRGWELRGPGGSGGTDVGRLALGRELANPNYCAKLLAKYVSPRHIRLLRGRFMVRRNSVFLKGCHLKLMDAN